MALATLLLWHGSPTLLTDPAMPGAALRQLGQRLPRPQAIFDDVGSLVERPNQARTLAIKFK